MQTAKYNAVPGCPRVEVLSIDYDKAAVRSDEAEPGAALLIVPVSDLSSFEGKSEPQSRGTAPTMSEEAARMVTAEAREQNGWEVLGVDFTHGNAGVIRFRREQAPHSGRHYGTAHFAISGDAVGFDWGHYDLSLEGSRRDFAERVQKGS